MAKGKPYRRLSLKLLAMLLLAAMAAVALGLTLRVLLAPLGPAHGVSVR